MDKDFWKYYKLSVIAGSLIYLSVAMHKKIVAGIVWFAGVLADILIKISL